MAKGQFTSIKKKKKIITEPYLTKLGTVAIPFAHSASFSTRLPELWPILRWDVYDNYYSNYYYMYYHYCYCLNSVKVDLQILIALCAPLTKKKSLAKMGLNMQLSPQSTIISSGQRRSIRRECSSRGPNLITLVWVRNVSTHKTGLTLAGPVHSGFLLWTHKRQSLAAGRRRQMQL